MKKHIPQKLSVFTLLAVLLTLLTSAPTASASTAGNLISDGDFEHEIGSNYFWEYYTASGQTSNADTVMLSSDEGLGGGSCLKLSGGATCGVKGNVTIPAENTERQKVYLFSVYCKATKGGVAQFPYIKVIRYDVNRQQVGTEVNLVNDATTVSASNQWTRITKSIVIQSNVTFFELQLRVTDTANTTGDDYVLFDKLMIEENLFTNSYGYGFENKSGAAVPTGDTATAVWQSDTDSSGDYAAHGGNIYLKIYNGAGGATKQFDFADSDVTNLQGQRFRLSFWLKSSTTDKGTALGVAAFKIFRKTSTNSTAGSTPLSGSSKINKVGDWYYMTPQEADTWEKFTIYFIFGGDGIKIPISACVPNGVPGYTGVSIDDVVLSRVPEATAHCFGDLYDNDEGINFSAGETVYAHTYYVPETTGETATMLSGLYEEKDGVVTLKRVQVNALSDQGFYEASFQIPETGNYFMESFIWKDTESLLPLKESIILRQQA